jgi:signal transduction histidine kinase
MRNLRFRVTKPFNVFEIVESSASLYADSAWEQEIEMVVDYDDILAWVVGDSHRYQRLLNNLISNAIKFTDAGSLEVFLTEVATAIGISVSRLIRFKLGLINRLHVGFFDCDDAIVEELF